MKTEKIDIETLSIKDFSNEQIRKALRNIEGIPMIYYQCNILKALRSYVYNEQSDDECGTYKFISGLNVFLDYMEFFNNLIEMTISDDFGLSINENSDEL